VARRGDLDRFDQCQPGDEGERRRRGIRFTRPDQGRAEEIAFQSLPRPSLAAAPGILAKRDQPVAFDRQRVAEQRAIGRADLLDDADAAQKSDPAALSAIVPSGPISR
jgi:hypothetical protein